MAVLAAFLVLLLVPSRRPAGCGVGTGVLEAGEVLALLAAGASSFGSVSVRFRDGRGDGDEAGVSPGAVRGGGELYSEPSSILKRKWPYGDSGAGGVLPSWPEPPGTTFSFGSSGPSKGLVPGVEDGICRWAIDRDAEGGRLGEDPGTSEMGSVALRGVGDAIVGLATGLPLGLGTSDSADPDELARAARSWSSCLDCLVSLGAGSTTSKPPSKALGTNRGGVAGRHDW